MQKKHKKPPDQLSDAIALVAKLGGHLGRTHDLAPGHQVMWTGYQVLQHMCLGVKLMAGEAGWCIEGYG
jgi:hypothetical protein